MSGELFIPALVVFGAIALIALGFLLPNGSDDDVCL